MHYVVECIWKGFFHTMYLSKYLYGFHFLCTDIQTMANLQAGNCLMAQMKQAAARAGATRDPNA